MAGIKFVSWFWILTEVYCSQLEYEYRTFRCSNGTYISGKFICDGDQDCIGDDIEENSDFCGSCGAGRFRCSPYFPYGDKCLDATARCNSIQDCNYYIQFDSMKRQDEHNCGDEVNKEGCSLKDGKFLCDDGKKCLELKYTCDSVCNCFDCSDEKSNCLNDGYVDNSATRSNSACFKTPNGPVCCSEFNSLCQECSSDEKCDQKCVQFVDKQVKCICNENYIGIPNTENTECALRNDVAQENWLLFSNGQYIGGINLLTDVELHVKRSIKGKCTALTALDQYLYYATDPPHYSSYYFNGHFYSFNDEQNKYSISKMSRISNKTYEIAKSNEMVTSLAVDWITNNIYYTTSSSLTACTSGGEICKKLKSGKTMQSIHLAPKFGLMFWISQQNISDVLKKSAMDGSDEKILIYFEYGNCSRSKIMQVDESAERIFLYCSDSRELRSITFNGEDRANWQFDPPFYKGVVFGRNIFYLGFDERKIFSMDRKSKIDVEQRFTMYSDDLIDHGVDFVDNLNVYNPRFRRAKVQNPCGSCTGLCLLRPSSDRFLNSTCFCCNEPITTTESTMSYQSVTHDDSSNPNTPFVVVSGAIFISFVILISIFFYFKYLKRSCSRN